MLEVRACCNTHRVSFFIYDQRWHSRDVSLRGTHHVHLCSCGGYLSIWSIVLPLALPYPLQPPLPPPVRSPAHGIRRSFVLFHCVMPWIFQFIVGCWIVVSWGWFILMGVSVVGGDYDIFVGYIYNFYSHRISWSRE